MREPVARPTLTVRLPQLTVANATPDDHVERGSLGFGKSAYRSVSLRVSPAFLPPLRRMRRVGGFVSTNSVLGDPVLDFETSLVEVSHHTCRPSFRGLRSFHASWVVLPTTEPSSLTV